jgi:hypothetical protein
MEAVYYAARGNLRRLLQLHPTWSRAQFAQATGMSLGWVSKWKKRLSHAPLDDEQVLHGLSRAPHHPPPRLDPQVVDRLLEIRDQPPEGLGRTPGPKAILYYLPRDESLRASGAALAALDTHHSSSQACAWTHCPSLASCLRTHRTSPANATVATRLQRCLHCPG